MTNDKLQREARALRENRPGGDSAYRGVLGGVTWSAKQAIGTGRAEQCAQNTYK